MTGIGKSAARRIAAVALLCVPPCEASNTPPDIGGLEDGCDDCASGRFDPADDGPDAEGHGGRRHL